MFLKNLSNLIKVVPTRSILRKFAVSVWLLRDSRSETETSREKEWKQGRGAKKEAVPETIKGTV
jgi:hypothetical protein